MSEIIQGSDEWKALRLGKVTASKICDVLADKKTAAYQNYRAELVCERLTGTYEDGFVSYDMQRGTALEPQAKGAYLFQTGLTGEDVAFIDHPTIGSSGCSPDLMVGDDGMAEFKAPKAKSHMDLLLGGKVKSIYRKQQQWQLSCTGKKWNDYVSYCPELPVELQLFIKRFDRDQEMIEEMEARVIEFLAEVDDIVAKLQQLITDRS